MTKIRKETYCCPKCKQYGEFKMYETINVDLDHTLKENHLPLHPNLDNIK